MFTRQGDPCWLKAERESRVTTRAFRRSFSASFVTFCEVAATRLKEDRKGKQAPPDTDVFRRFNSVFAPDYNANYDGS